MCTIRQFLCDKLTDRCDVGESMRDQHPAVFVLHPLEQLEHRVLHVRHQHRLLRGRVALPPAGEIIVNIPRERREKGEKYFGYNENSRGNDKYNEAICQTTETECFSWENKISEHFHMTLCSV